MNSPMKPYMTKRCAPARAFSVPHSMNLRWENTSTAAPITAAGRDCPCSVRGYSEASARLNLSMFSTAVTPAKLTAGMKMASITGTGSILAKMMVP